MKDQKFGSSFFPLSYLRAFLYYLSSRIIDCISLELLNYVFFMNGVLMNDSMYQLILYEHFLFLGFIIPYLNNSLHHIKTLHIKHNLVLIKHVKII